MRGVHRVEKTKFTEIMKQGMNELKLEINEKIIDNYWIYMNFLFQENEKYNLTGIKKPEEAIRKHFLDSLAPLPYLNISRDNRIIDVGTGAGFPGLVLKIFKTDIKIVLLDSTLKKINFLNLLVKKLNITKNLELIHNRAEKLGKDENYRESFDYVFSRAVAPINVLCEYTLPFISQQGSVVFYKGPEYKAEIKEAGNSLKELGGEVQDIIRLKVPGLKAQRFLILIKKSSITPGSYPRRVGIPKKRPL